MGTVMKGMGTIMTMTKGAVMGMGLYMGIAVMPNQMKMNLFLMLGTMMVFRGGPMAYVMGAMIHAVASIVFALIHVGVYNAFGLETELVAWGALFGFVHWISSGMGLGMMRFMHPLMRRGEMDDPGAFALKFPAMTAMGFFMLHIVFGVLVGTFYEVFI